jgi:hypothetical protein
MRFGDAEQRNSAYRMTSDDLRLTNCGYRSPRRRRYNPYEPEASLCSFKNKIERIP